MGKNEPLTQKDLEFLRRQLKRILEPTTFNDCPRCSHPLSPGDSIVQMSRGNWYSGHITPTYIEVIEEWHVECYEKEFQLRPQSMPYTCDTCGRAIEHGDEVFYGCIGAKAAPGYTRPEQRGNQLYLVKHASH
jgi:hypothetical protein